MRKWKRDNSFIGLRGRTEPNHHTGSSALYGTGADVSPIDDWQRKNCHFDFKRKARPNEKYALSAVFKWGNLKHGKTFGGYSETVEEGKTKCEAWLEQCELEYQRSRQVTIRSES